MRFTVRAAMSLISRRHSLKGLLRGHEDDAPSFFSAEFI